MASDGIGPPFWKHRNDCNAIPRTHNFAVGLVREQALFVLVEFFLLDDSRVAKGRQFA